MLNCEPSLIIFFLKQPAEDFLEDFRSSLSSRETVCIPLNSQQVVSKQALVGACTLRFPLPLANGVYAIRQPAQQSLGLSVPFGV